MKYVLIFGNIEYKILRGIKPNLFEIYKDGILIPQDAASKDYQEYLEVNILRTNYKAFTQVVILGSARYTPFMQLSAADRRSVIEELLDIQIFSTMNLLVKDKLTVLKDELKTINYDIELNKIQINNKNSIIKENKKKSINEIEIKKEQISKYETEINNFTNNIELIEKHIEVLNYKILAKEKIEKKQKSLSLMEGKLNENIKNLNKDIKFYSNNDSCPTCKQEINDIFKKEILDKNSYKKQKLEEGFNKLESEISILESKLDNIYNIINIISEHQNEISRVKGIIKSYIGFIKDLNLEIDNIRDFNSDVTIHVNELKNIISEYEEKIKLKNDLIDQKKHLEYCSILLKDGGIKTKIVKKYLPLLNKLINKYLLKLDFFVNFNINENFEEVIKSRHRDEFQYNNFSEGQKLKIDLSLLLAFRELSKLKNSVNCNLLLLDEIIDGSFDENAISLFLDLLDNIEGNIFVISPKGEEFSDNFDGKIVFELQKNFSRMKKLDYIE